MLIKKLDDDLIEKLNLNKKNFPFIFFFDKNEEFRLLVENSKEFKVIFYDDSLLEIKYELLRYSEENPVIIYLPFDEDEDLLYLMDLLVCSVKYHNTLYRFMENIGISFPKNAKKRREIIKLLPSMVKDHYDKPLSFWNEEFGTPVIKDFYKKFKEILINPQNLVEFDYEKRTLFINEINKKYGFKFPGQLENWDIEFIIFLCIVEMYVDTQDSEYPLLQKLPSNEMQINQCVEILKEIKNHIELKEKYKQACFKIQKGYDLKSFIKKNIKTIDTLLQSEKVIISHINKRIQSCNSKDDFNSVLNEYKELIRKKISNFWVREGEITAWSYLSILLEFIELIEEFKTISDLKLEQYIRKYYRIDQIYRIQKGFEWYEEGLEYITPWIEKLYLEFLDKINIKFNEILERKIEFIEYNIQKNYLPNLMKRNNAFLMIDALRYELGEELYKKLKNEFNESEIKPLFASRPPITSIGFSNLITDDLNYEIIEKKSIIVKKANGKDLNTKSKRINFLKDKYKKCEFLNLDKFLNIKSKSEIDKLKDYDNLILFSNDIDEMGESKGERWIKFFTQVINDIIKAIRKLIKIGYTTIHILTDHGFLSFDDKDDHFKLKDYQGDYVIKKRRFLISDKSDIQDFIKEELECSKGYYIYYPRSIYYLKKDSFFHGGISIQELLIPHIIIKVKDKKIKHRPQIEIQDLEGIFNRLFPIYINSILKSTGLEPLVRSRKIKIWGELDNETITNAPIIEIDPGLNKVMLRLIKSNIPKGAKISIIVQDNETEEILHKIIVEIKKEFIDDF
ncbi:MAG: PglZ domain-containing protein [Promethearchaeota archaeon]